MYLLLKKPLALWVHTLCVLLFSLFIDEHLFAKGHSPTIIPVKYGNNNDNSAFFEFAVNYKAIHSPYKPDPTDIKKENTTESLLKAITRLSCTICPESHLLRFTTKKYDFDEVDEKEFYDEGQYYHESEWYDDYEDMPKFTTGIDIFSLKGEHLFSVTTTEEILFVVLPEETWDTLLLTQDLDPYQQGGISPFDTNRLIQYKNMLTAALEKLPAAPRKDNLITIDVSSTSCVPETIDEQNCVNLTDADQYHDISYRHLNSALLFYMVNEENILPLVLMGDNKTNQFLSSIESFDRLNGWLQTAKTSPMTLPGMWSANQPDSGDNNYINPALVWGGAYYKQLCRLSYKVKIEGRSKDKAKRCIKRCIKKINQVPLSIVSPPNF